MSDSDEGNMDGPAMGIDNPYPDDTIRIMLATDNHIGYMERDPVRGQDSINTFREILQLAVKHEVDFILLAGDLFHENKPSRECLYQTMALLRQYTLGNKPIEIELLSDPDEGHADGYSFPAINYEDPNLNVSIPVFSIHGNHDDPQGAGAEGALCALDMLSVAGLINYMGKFDLTTASAETEPTDVGIAVRPVLLRKGNTHLGMYGVGNVKDARMHFELKTNRVRMFMPKDKDNWFNIMLLHQNRVKHGPQESVPEGMFDDSIDLVVWGHEHDCRIIPESVAGKKYVISQPGSSIATSLADGESLEKHVALLLVQGKQFHMQTIPLRTVRPFELESVVLSEVAEEEGFELNDQIAITKFLKARVNALIQKANATWTERNTRTTTDGLDPLPPMLPLIRLKVDTTGVTEMSNPIRFGQEFQGVIANPRDVLIFHRAKKSTARSGGKVSIDQPDLDDGVDGDMSIGERLEKVRVANLVKEYLGAQELQLLGEMGMSDAIQMFVEKDDTHAIQSHVNKSLKGLFKGMQKKENIDEEELEELLAQAKAEEDDKYKQIANEGRSSKSKKGKGKAKADDDDDQSDAPSVDSMLMDIDGGGGDASEVLEIDSDDAPPKKKTTKAPAKKTTTTAAKKAPATKKAPVKKATVAVKKAPAKRGKKAVVSDSDEIIEIDDDEIEDDDEDDNEPPPPPKKSSRAAVLSQPAKKTPAAGKKKAPAAGGSKQGTLSFAPAGSARPSRAAASKAKSRMKDVTPDEEDSD